MKYEMEWLCTVLFGTSAILSFASCKWIEGFAWVCALLWAQIARNRSKEADFWQEQFRKAVR